MTSKSSSWWNSSIAIMEEIRDGIAVGFTHPSWFVKDLVRREVVAPISKLLGITSWSTGETTSSSTTSPSSSTLNTLKVVGVGYGRTGTYSLALALEELGYPTLHTQHMYENRAILDMWHNTVFLPCIEAQHASLQNPDLNMIAQAGFSATMDLPTALYFETLLNEDPSVKFILTTRTSSKVWFKSWSTLTKAITVPTRRFDWMWHAKKINNYYRWLFAMVNQDDTYLTKPMPLPDQNEKRAIESYEQHNARVRELVPPDRLLEYHVKEGWEPLCTFLNIEQCPMDKPFPKTNSALSVQVQAVSAQLIPLVVTGAIVIVFWAIFRKKQNKKTKYKTS